METQTSPSRTLRLRFQDDLRLDYTVVTRGYQEARQGDRLLAREENNLSGRLHWRVLRSEADGSGHILMVTTPDDPTSAPRQVLYQQLSARGDVLEVTGPDPGSMFSFPEEAVGIGSTWNGISRGYLAGQLEPVLTPYTYRVEGLQERCGRECFLIELESDEIQFEMPAGEGKTTRIRSKSTGRMHFDAERGQLVRLELKTVSRPEIQELSFENQNIVIQELVPAG